VRDQSKNDETCRFFRLIFDGRHMVSYTVLNESYGDYPALQNTLSESCFAFFIVAPAGVHKAVHVRFRRMAREPIASASIAVTRLLMLTPSFFACSVNLRYSVRGNR
jgi:ABC-type phosphate transport system permease subunit